MYYLYLLFGDRGIKIDADTPFGHIMMHREHEQNRGKEENRMRRG